MSLALSTLVTVQVLFTRKYNENITTAFSPVGAYVPGMVDLDEEGTFCRSFDDNAAVKGKLYSVNEVELPEWLSADEWARNFVTWKYTWGHGVEKTWPEAWQRSLCRMSSVEKEACVKLLKTKKFRSDFRKSLCDQLVAWLETPADERTYRTPFSPRQWDAAIDRWTAINAHRTAEQLYACR